MAIIGSALNAIVRLEAETLELWGRGLVRGLVAQRIVKTRDDILLDAGSEQGTSVFRSALKAIEACTHDKVTK